LSQRAISVPLFDGSALVRPIECPRHNVRRNCRGRTGMFCVGPPRWDAVLRSRADAALVTRPGDRALHCSRHPAMSGCRRAAPLDAPDLKVAMKRAAGHQGSEPPNCPHAPARRDFGDRAHTCPAVAGVGVDEDVPPLWTQRCRCSAGSSPARQGSCRGQIPCWPMRRGLRPE
jgi:hypothetical protein